MALSLAGQIDESESVIVAAVLSSFILRKGPGFYPLLCYSAGARGYPGMVPRVASAPPSPISQEGAGVPCQLSCATGEILVNAGPGESECPGCSGPEFL